MGDGQTRPLTGKTTACVVSYAAQDATRAGLLLQGGGGGVKVGGSVPPHPPKGKQSDTEALCQPPHPHPRRRRRRTLGLH